LVFVREEPISPPFSAVESVIFLSFFVFDNLARLGKFKLLMLPDGEVFPLIFTPPLCPFPEDRWKGKRLALTLFFDGLCGCFMFLSKRSHGFPQDLIFDSLLRSASSSAAPFF